jgi:hypothetical protein
VAIDRHHATTGDDLGLLEHPAPNPERGDVVVVPDGRDFRRPLTPALERFLIA